MRDMDKEASNVNQPAQLFHQVAEFLNAEADMLNHREYQDWLSLWSPSGLYIVPIDAAVADYKNTLNIAYDDQHMRQLRVQRLESGEAMSISDGLSTVRLISAMRITGVAGDTVKTRCAYCLYENKNADLRIYPAQVEFVLRHHQDSFLIEKKIVKLLRANQYLATVSYIF